MTERGMGALAGRWHGRHWRWWSLAVGIALVPLTALVAALVATLANERVVPLLLLFLIIEILAVSLLGSGLIGSLSDMMIRGGLARESTDYVDAVESATELEKLEARNKAAQDQLTIRAGLIVLPLIVAFVYFMTQI